VFSLDGFLVAFRLVKGLPRLCTFRKKERKENLLVNAAIARVVQSLLSPFSVALNRLTNKKGE
jgi:hypothetical protein